MRLPSADRPKRGWCDAHWGAIAGAWYGCYLPFRFPLEVSMLHKNPPPHDTCMTGIASGRPNNRYGLPRRREARKPANNITERYNSNSTPNTYIANGVNIEAEIKTIRLKTNNG